jgi:hypothetical protein
MHCPNCGQEYKEGWKFCTKCAKPLPDEFGNITEICETSVKPEEIPSPSVEKATSKKKIGCLGAITICVFMLIVIGVTTGNDKSKSVPAQQSSSSTTPPAENKPTKIENWQYSENNDTIHNSKFKLAKATSVNTLNFKFPYTGSQHAYLVIRKNYDGSKDVMVSIEKGQFLTSVLGGKALIRFDDSSPEEFQLLSSQDNSTTVVFIKYADYFIKNVSKSKKVYFQTSFYQEGNPTIEFNIDGLKEL